MPRERLLRFLDTVWDRRLGLVVAPAGSGKTVLLSQFAAHSTAAVAWYRAERGDGDARVLLRHLEHAARRALGAVDGPWTDETAAASSLARATVSRRLLLLIDDGHFLATTPGEAALRRLIGYLPDTARVVIAGRIEPAVDLTRLRLSGLVAELGPDDLRFRLWEVERVFAQFYGERLTPEDVAELARRTAGWAAGLQLFHLATTGRSAAERRATMTALSTRSRLAREYLSRHLLADLDEGTRWFLVHTSVLGRLTGPLCDALLARDGSAAVLAMLERRQLFTHALGDGVYRYHDVLRSHLEAVLVEELGEAAVCDQLRRAGALLEREPDAFGDALEAYCRAEAWDAAGRLIGLHGEHLTADATWWWTLLPSSFLAQDGWAVLALARRHRAGGRWHAAHEAYRSAERLFAGSAGTDVCRREAASVAAWIGHPSGQLAAGWPGLLREATMRRPLSVMRAAARRTSASDRLVEGWSALLAGHVALAVPVLERAAGDAEASAAMRLCARAGLCAAATLRGEANDDGFIVLADVAARSGLPWLAAALWRGVAPSAMSDQGHPAAPPGTMGDPWSSAIAQVLRGWRAALNGVGLPDPLAGAALAFSQVRAAVLRCWAEAVRAVAEAQTGLAAALDSARHAAADANEIGVPGARAYALHVLAWAAGDATRRRAALDAATQLGLRLPPLPDRPPQPAGPVSTARARIAGVDGAPLAITCLGRFNIAVHGRPVDLAPVKPKARSLLRLLAMHCGRPVHREIILEALWPACDPDAGTRSLHVAVSSLRRLLEPRLWRSSTSMVHRDSDAYGLALPVGTTIDLVEFHDRLARAERSASPAEAAAELTAALRLYRDDLLPEEGPAEWVTTERDRHRAAAVGAAASLARLAVAGGDAVGAATACRRGLAIDRYQDCLWRLLIESHERDRAPAAAERARREYAAVLAELDLRAR